MTNVARSIVPATHATARRLKYCLKKNSNSAGDGWRRGRSPRTPYNFTSRTLRSRCDGFNANAPLSSRGNFIVTVEISGRETLGQVLASLTPDAFGTRRCTTEISSCFRIQEDPDVERFRSYERNRRKFKKKTPVRRPGPYRAAVFFSAYTNIGRLYRSVLAKCCARVMHAFNKRFLLFGPNNSRFCGPARGGVSPSSCIILRDARVLYAPTN